MASHDNSGVPQWLAELGIKPGDFYIDSKLKLRRAMKSPCFSGAARIYACLCLHSAGFKQELAVKKEAGKEVPLQPSEVCSMTGVDRKHFREYMTCLEASGLAKCEGLTKGRVLLYCYVVPRPVEVPKIVPGPGTIFDEGFPPELISLLKHFKVRFPPDFVPGPGTILELQRLAEAAKEAELSLRQYAKGPVATPPLNKDERKTLEIDKTEESGGRKTSSSVEEPEQSRSSPPLPTSAIVLRQDRPSNDLPSSETPLYPDNRRISQPDSQRNVGGYRDPSEPGAYKVSLRDPDGSPRPLSKSSNPLSGVDLRLSPRKDVGRRDDLGLVASSTAGAVATRDPEAERQVVAGNPKSTDAFEVFCFVMHGCGRPVAVKCVRECRAEFFKYPPTTQQRIIEDANLRFKGDNPRFITAPLKYLCSEIWDTEPITRPLFSPPASTAQQQRDDALRRLMDRARARDQEFGDLR